MRGKCMILGFVLTFLVLSGTKAEALILINEILADPKSGIAGDANGDGVGSTTRDEFIELFNSGDGAVDLTGWSLSDAVKSRHVFAVDSVVSAKGIIVVFGGGSPLLPGINWQTASTGSLGLNNGGDTVTLYNSGSEIIDRVIYGSEAGKDQSIVRFPEGEGDVFIQHLSLPNADTRRFSPGYFVNAPLVTDPPSGGDTDLPEGDDPVGSTTTPEPATLCSLGLGMAAELLRRRRQR